MNRYLLSALALATLPTHAFAHAYLTEGRAVAGRSFKAVAAIPHGCDGQATVAVAMMLPDGFVGAKPMPKSGWTLEIRQGDYARPYALHGSEVTSGPVEIRWTGGRLEDAWYDEFTVLGTFAGELAGTTVNFPLTQDCEGGASVAWDQVAAAGVDPHSLEHPAPSVSVVAATADAAGGHGGHDMAAMAMGPISAEGGFARAMLPNAKVGGGYVTLENGGSEPDRLLGASSPAAGRVEIHTMEMNGDVMTMRKAETGLEIPAGGQTALMPGGTHLMFLDVAKRFAEGDKIPLTLRFEKAGPVETSLVVGPPNASAPAGAAAEEGGHVH